MIRLHISYLFSKSSIVILSLSLTINSIIFIVNAYNSFVSYYFKSSLNVSILLTIFLFSYIFSSSFSSKNDSYAQIVVSLNINKKKYVLTKVLSLIILLFFYSLLLICLFLLIGFIFVYGFYFTVSYLYFYLSLFLLSLYYSLASILLTLLFKTPFSFLLCLFLYVLSSSLEEELITFLAPTIDEYLYLPKNGIVNCFFLVLTLLIAIIFIYDKLEIKYE